jgi:DNA-binding MarR family transcriptional regulator
VAETNFGLRVPASFEQEFPSASRPATECGINLVRTTDLLLAEIERRRRSVADLGASAAQILAIVEGAGEPIPPSVIARRLLVTTGTMTSLLDTLERRGLIRRLPHPDDRRMLLIDVTDEARAICDSMLPRVHAGFREIFASLSEPEKQVLLDLLCRVQQRLLELKDQEVDIGQERRVKIAEDRSRRQQEQGSNPGSQLS